jgi:hypothetical protein
MYAFLKSGQISLYPPERANLSRFCVLCNKWFCRVLFVRKAICKCECLNIVVMYLVS